VRKEKLDYKKALTDENDEEVIYEIEEELNQIDIEIKAIQDNIETLEEKQDFINIKM
jgi:hypothetical protein